jgi:hypothetical protein
MRSHYTISPHSKTLPTPMRVAPPSPTFSARIKAVIVDALGFLLAWKPTIAMFLGCLVLRVWPCFRRA